MPSVLVALASLTLSEPADGHEREFTQSRDWHLPYASEHEFELRSFFDTSHGDYRGQLEYEYGVTQHFAVEPGFEIAENEDGDYEIEGGELELRFNFGEFTPSRWLPALNIEWEHPFESGEPDSLELRGVLSFYGELNDFTVNLNGGHEMGGDQENESELTAGWLHHFDVADETGNRPGVKLGLEMVQDFEQHHLQAGPLAVYRLGEHLNALASYLPGIDDDEDNFDVLTILLEWEL